MARIEAKQCEHTDNQTLGMFMECFLFRAGAGPLSVELLWLGGLPDLVMCLRKGESVEDSVAVLGGYTDLVVLRHPGKVGQHGTARTTIGEWYHRDRAGTDEATL